MELSLVIFGLVWFCFTLPGSLSKSQSRLASLLKPHVPGPKTNCKLVPVATMACHKANENNSNINSVINFIWMKQESNFYLSNQIRRHTETENLARGLLLIPLCTSFIRPLLLSVFLAFPVCFICQGSIGAYAWHRCLAS